MKRFGLILAVILLVLVVGAVIALATWRIPAPSAPVEKPIPNERLPK